MLSFAQTWHRIALQLKKKRSFHSHGNSKSVRFYDIETVFYTHSSLEYDRTPSAEQYEDSYLDEEEEDDDDDDDDDDDVDEVDENIEDTMAVTALSPSLHQQDCMDSRPFYRHISNPSMAEKSSWWMIIL